MASEEKTLKPDSPPADLAPLKPEQIAQIMAGSGAVPIHGPVVNASYILVMLAANDAMLVFGRPHPLFLPNGQVANIATTDTTAIIHMSMATLKDAH